ncbi:MAG TPA: hypothetical protein PLI90_11165 [Rhodocyclaceae bacterium]|jgi:hypothetical protein|nr:hypothetical protein [Rhodocyclaceae bacterium]
MTNGTPVAIQESRKGKMERLCLLESETEIQEAVKRIAVSFGKVHSVIPISLQNRDDNTEHAEYAFTINFENTLDAMTAAKELKGFLYGFSALVVKIRRNGNRQKQ